MNDFYATQVWYLDCDGVILDSNQVKSQAFYEVTEPMFGPQIAQDFVRYHKENGGISRFVKFEHLLKNIALCPAKDFQRLHEKLLELFSKKTYALLLRASLTDGCEDFLKYLKQNRKKAYVVSGGLETELVKLFKTRGLSSYFAGIHGSPRTKFAILQSLVSENDAQSAFIGDSQLDHEAAQAYKLPFYFLYQYSEFKNYKTYFRTEKDSLVFQNFSSLMKEYTL